MTTLGGTTGGAKQPKLTQSESAVHDGQHKGSTLGGKTGGTTLTASAGNANSNNVTTQSGGKKKKRKKRPASQMGKPIKNVVPTHHSLFAVSSDEEEEESEYKRGGYHPVRLGNVLIGKYKIIHKLGWGHFSTVWLADDLYRGGHVAVKIVKSASHYTDAAMDEIQILEKVREEDPEQKYIIRLIDNFELHGPNGTHVTMVFEKMACNLLTITKMYRYKGMPISLTKMIVKQILHGLDFMHTRCSLIHTDLKPENILLLDVPQTSLMPQDEEVVVNEKDENDKEGVDDNSDSDGHTLKQRPKLPYDRETLLKIFGHNQSYKCKIVDLGNACWTHKHFTDDVQTRQYRAPEIILGSPYDTAIDIWSLGCMVFEFLTGDLLFEPKSGKNFGKNDDHLAQMIEAIGPFPRHISQKGKYSERFFDRKGNLLHVHNLKYWPLKDVLIDKYSFDEETAEVSSDFILNMIKLVPSERSTAGECLEHPWLRDIDLENFESAFELCNNENGLTTDNIENGLTTENIENGQTTDNIENGQTTDNEQN
jgi:serine/threonine-protein kinase SRPK3